MDTYVEITHKPPFFRRYNTLLIARIREHVLLFESIVKANGIGAQDSILLNPAVLFSFVETRDDDVISSYGSKQSHI